MNRSMVITEDLFALFLNCLPLEYFYVDFSVLLSAAIVLAAAGRELTADTPQ